MTDFYRVLILSYNHPEITRRCVQSALAAGIEANKIILIHNGSEKPFVQGLLKKIPDVQHLILPKNTGFTGGINQGLQFAFKQSDWVYFLTNDTEVINLPKLKPQEPALIAPLVYRRKTSVIASRLGFFDPRWGELRHLHTAKDFSDLSLQGYLYAPGTGFLIHKNVFFSVGGFDESLHTYWEDVDFSVRAQKAGFQVKHDSNLSLIHFIGKTCHKKSFYTTFLYQRNRKFISLRYVNSKYVGILSLILLKDFLFYAIRFSMARRWKEIWLLLTAYLSRDSGLNTSVIGPQIQESTLTDPHAAIDASLWPSLNPIEPNSDLIADSHEPSTRGLRHPGSKHEHDEYPGHTPI